MAITEHGRGYPSRVVASDNTYALTWRGVDLLSAGVDSTTLSGAIMLNRGVGVTCMSCSTSALSGANTDTIWLQFTIPASDVCSGTYYVPCIPATAM